MGWIRPKTNWENTDYINYTDINRIIKNLIFLRGYAIQKYVVPDFIQMPLKTGYADMIYASEINHIEDNLDTLATAIDAPDIGEKKTYLPNGNGFDAEELNRLEGATVVIYNYLNIKRERFFTWNFGTKGVFN